VVLNRRADATDRLLAVADQVKGQLGTQTADLAWREAPVNERLAHALVEGIADFVVEDTEEARRPGRASDPGDRGPAHGRHETSSANLFGAGKMFLPQVVKSARAS